MGTSALGLPTRIRKHSLALPACSMLRSWLFFVFFAVEAGERRLGRLLVGVKSRLRSGTRRNHLRVLELVLFQPTTCDLCQSFVPKLVPALFQAESSDCAPECTKGSRSVNSIQQLTPDLPDVLCSRESLHD